MPRSTLVLTTHILSLLLIVPASAQKIDWTTAPDFPNWEMCLQFVFLYSYILPEGFIQCQTMPCMCEAGTIQNNEPYIYGQAISLCTATGQAKSATSIVDRMCSEAGYTERLGEVEPKTTEGAEGPAATSARTTLRATTLRTVAVDGTPQPTSAPDQGPETSPVPPDSGLSRDNKVAIILGTVVPAIALLITIYFMRRYRPQQIWDRLRHPFQSSTSQDTEMSTLRK